MNKLIPLPTSGARYRWAVVYRVSCVIATAVCALYGASSLWAPLSGLCETLSYIAPVWTALLVILTMLFLYDRRLRYGAAAPLLLAVATQAVVGMPTLAPPSQGPGDFDVMTFNISFSNNRVDEVVEYLQEEEGPSIVAVLEVSAAHRSQLESLVTRYPYHEEFGITDTAYGMMVFSTLPLERIVADEATLPNRSMVLRVHDDDRAFQVVAVHLFSPHSNFPERHRSESERLARYLATVGDPMVLLGDFNSTPWSGRLRHIAKVGRLESARTGFGWLPTWPAHRGWTCFPVDHILVSESIFDVVACTRGPRCGSDHYPLRASLRYLPTP